MISGYFSISSQNRSQIRFDGLKCGFGIENHGNKTHLILDRKQGGSVMGARPLISDSVHLHFSLNCLPNEEEIKKINISTYRSTNY